MEIRDYGKVYALGHREVKDIFSGPVQVEEKVDGSQFSFGFYGADGIKCRSRGKQIDLNAPERLFEKAIETVLSFTPDAYPRAGCTYRCEYLAKPKHNTLAYDRVPAKNLVVFDIDAGIEMMLSYEEKKQEAERLGLEVVPLLASGEFNGFSDLEHLLETTSFLGGQNVEGFVVKNYRAYTAGGHILKGKFVSEGFKEVHKKDWRGRHPAGKDIKAMLGERYRNESRWTKAVHHLRESGELRGDPRDIGPLIKAVQSDIREECGEDIKDELFRWAWGDLSRVVVAGLPEWYKRKLAGD